MIARWVLFFGLLALPVWAVQPDEMLKDPELEARARALSTILRCLVCRNESIDESHASLARDLRILLRERLAEGDTDTEAVAFLVDRYGEYVLLKPQMRGANLILWWAGPAMFVGGLIVAGAFVRRRRRAEPQAMPLTKEEAARLRDLLQDQG